MPEGQDYVITELDEFPTSPIARWNANIRAIRILKELGEEKRPATDAERRALARYAGFGDSEFEDAFRPSGTYNPAWRRRREELEELVTDDELEGIRRSRINAFYTTPQVVNSMWKGLSAMGADRLENPKVLEPSAGSGRFLGLQPTEMAARSTRVAVELDPVTADVLKHLYPETRVFKAGFQEAPVADNHFDIAISNVPFGKIKVYDPEFNATGRAHLTSPVHNYFFAKTLDKLRPGGVMAFITSRHTMDAARAETVREYMAERADLLGAMRLPSDAFPDTQVVTDIIYLRKREPGSGPGDDSWVKTEAISVPDQYGSRRTESVNRYYIDNPDRVIGQHSGAGSMNAGGTYTVKSDAIARPLGPTLTRETQEIARAATITARRPSAESRPKVARPNGPTKYVVRDGELWAETDGDAERHDLPKKTADRVRGLVGLRDTARLLVQQEGSDTAWKNVESTRKDLREKYVAYVEEFGEAVNTPANRKLMGNDSDDHLLFALESYDKETECWQASDIIHKRVVGAAPVQSVRTPADAMSVSLNESGQLDFDRMGKMLGRSGAEVREELANDELVYQSPDGASWIPAAEYLSGNVRAKLQAAQLAARTNPVYEKHVAALRQVQPEKVTAEDISTPLGAPWIPADVVNEWVDEHMRPRNWRGDSEYFRYIPEGESFVTQDAKGKNKREGATGLGGSWSQANKILADRAVLRSEWGTEEKSAEEILLKTLQGTPISVTMKGPDGSRVQDQEGTLAAQEKAKEMQKSFDEWVWRDPDRRERLEEQYNETHNATRPRKFDGGHQTFPGMALQWQQQLHPHQRDAIYRVVNDGTTLLAHEVGFGKSATVIAAAKERKRLGLANKPVFVVPKATHEQFVGQFMEIYPGAKILSPDQSDFKAGNREQFLSRIATGDWDGIVLTSEQFEKIPLSPATEAKWIRQQRDEMLGSLLDMEGDSGQTQQTQKKIQIKIENYEARLKVLRDRMADRSDDTLHFEDLGIDQLYVDEADRYKNLGYVTRMTAGRTGVKGLPQSESQRAWDMYMKIRHLQDEAGQKADGSFAKGGVVFATGTPVANTIAETWTMMRYLQPDELKRRGVDNFDAWAKTYGNTTTGIEQTAAGTYRPTQRFSKFVNLPELGTLFQNVADIRVAAEVPEMMAAQPDHERVTVVSPPHPALTAYMQAVVKRVENLGNVDPREDNMLKISGDARKAALDVRMVWPNAPYNPDGKIATVAGKVAEVYREEDDRKGTQLVFLDIGTPKAGEGKDEEVDAAPGEDEELTEEERQTLSNVYGALRNELAGRGVPEEKVAFIHDYKTPASREDLFDQVRTGDVRVLVGSTEKIGVGVNVQDRAAAAHHVDVPWRPRDVEQREGRIIRQGNEVYGPVLDDETRVRLAPGRGVKIYQYVQEGSFDGFMWQAVEVKASAIKSLIKQEHTARAMDDIDPFVLGAAEAKALASGNPLVGRAETLRQKVHAGRMMRAAHEKQTHAARVQRRELGSQIAAYRAMQPSLEADAHHVGALPADADFAATIAGEEYDKRPDAGRALEAALKKSNYDPSGSVTPIGSFKGFTVGGANTDAGYRLVIQRPETQQPYHSGYIDRGDISPIGVMSRIDNLVKGLPDRAERIRDKMATGESSLAIYAAQLQKPFAEGPALAHSERQLRVIEARLSEDPEALREGDDYEMDVMADFEPVGGVRSAARSAPTPREVPDVDAVTLREAVAVTRSPEEADTPEEVADALEDVIETPGTEIPAATTRVEGPEDEEYRPPAERKTSATEVMEAADLVLDKLKSDRAYQNALAMRGVYSKNEGSRTREELEGVIARERADASLGRAEGSTQPISEPIGGEIPPTPETPLSEPLAAVEDRVDEVLEEQMASPAAQARPLKLDAERRLAERKVREEAAAADLVLDKLKGDRAYQNALANSDAQNIRIEFDAALQRAMTALLVEGRTDLYKQFIDDLDYRERLAYRLETRAPKEAKAEPLVDRDPTRDIRQVRREITQLGGSVPSVPSGASLEELESLRDDLKARRVKQVEPTATGILQAEDEAEEKAASAPTAPVRVEVITSLPRNPTLPIDSRLLTPHEEKNNPNAEALKILRAASMENVQKDLLDEGRTLDEARQGARDWLAHDLDEAVAKEQARARNQEAAAEPNPKRRARAKRVKPTPRLDTGSRFAPGTKIYYTGDVANQDGFGEIVEVLPNTNVKIKMDDGRTWTLFDQQVGTKYEGHARTRFVTREAYDSYRSAKIAAMKADAEALQRRREASEIAPQETAPRAVVKAPATEPDDKPKPKRRKAKAKAESKPKAKRRKAKADVEPVQPPLLTPRTEPAEVVAVAVGVGVVEPAVTMVAEPVLAAVLKPPPKPKKPKRESFRDRVIRQAAARAGGKRKNRAPKHPFLSRSERA